MTTRATDWLPAEALADPRFEAAVRQVVPRWSERWVGTGEGYTLADVQRSKQGALSRIAAHDWRATDTGISVAWSDQLGLSLGLAITDAAQLKPRSASDRALLTELAWEALSDLAKMAAAALKIGDNAAGDISAGLGMTQWQVRHLKKHYPALALRLPTSALVQPRKAMIGSPLRNMSPSGTLGEACYDARLPVKAVLGNASISWGELESLELGDVVVLDVAIDQSFALLSAGSGSEVCRLTLGQESGRLQLVAAENQT